MKALFSFAILALTISMNAEASTVRYVCNVDDNSTVVEPRIAPTDKISIEDSEIALIVEDKDANFYLNGDVDLKHTITPNGHGGYHVSPKIKDDQQSQTYEFLKCEDNGSGIVMVGLMDDWSLAMECQCSEI